jgi:glucose-6-phosphate 1-dehydrogenase
MAKQPGLDREGIRLREVPLAIGMADAFADSRRRIAYERLLLDLIEGDPTLFVRRDEVEAQWQWIDGIRAAWDAGDMRPAPMLRHLGPERGHRADRARREELE